MRQLWIAWMASLVMGVLLGIPGMAAAQAPGQIDPASATFLEKRVPEELAIEGVVLSRRNLALQVEQLGDRWLVSLVDLTTGRVAASTKVDALPADREAAVATMTHVVSDLAAEIGQRGEPPTPPSTVPPPPPLPAFDQRAEREQREIAELRFRRQALKFGDVVVVTATSIGTTPVVSVSRNWVVQQGELNQELTPREFYTLVNRPDLAETYASRRSAKIAGYVVGGIAMGAGALLALASQKDCPVGMPFAEFDMCLDDNRNSFYTALGVGTAIGLIGMTVGLWYSLHQHPITENEAKSLADVYNQGLRRELGLPVARREPRPRLPLRDVKLTPFVARADTGGLALTGRF